MTADFVGWHDEHMLDHRRRLRTAMFVSLALHGVLIAIVATSPPQQMTSIPEYLSVDLVAAPLSRSSARPPAPTPSASPPKPPPAASSTPPPAAEPPPAPVAKAPVQVLPEETPGRIREAKPTPKVVAKVEPKPDPKPAPRRRRREKAVSYEDAMAALADELGVDESAPVVEAQTNSDDSPEEDSANAPTGEIVISPAQLAWDRSVRQKISRRFVDLARYRGQGLVAGIEIEILANGAVRGEPRLVRTSGDLDFDGRAMAAILLSGPFLPPPEPGKRRLDLTSEAR